MTPREQRIVGWGGLLIAALTFLGYAFTQSAQTGTPAPPSGTVSTDPTALPPDRRGPPSAVPSPRPAARPTATEPAPVSTPDPVPTAEPTPADAPAPLPRTADPGPSSWARAGRPNETSFKGRTGFKVVVTLEPAAAAHPLYALPMKGGRLGAFYRFVSGSGQTAEGRSCEAWLDSSGVYGTWAIEGNAVPARDQWTELGAPVRLSVSYWCDGPVADGEAVGFDLGLYVLDDGGRARMARWSASDVPVRSQSVRLAR